MAVRRRSSTMPRRRHHPDLYLTFFIIKPDNITTGFTQESSPKRVGGHTIADLSGDVCCRFRISNYELQRPVCLMQLFAFLLKTRPHGGVVAVGRQLPEFKDTESESLQTRNVSSRLLWKDVNAVSELLTVTAIRSISAGPS